MTEPRLPLPLPPAPPTTTTAASTEPCWRCGTLMEWRHATLQCPRCRFKIGCCEGATGECVQD